MNDKRISAAVISRLPRYYRYLRYLLTEGVDRISSRDLSIMMNVTASQIRQDLNNFGGFGQQGYGYNVSYLYNEIGKILGVDKNHNIVVIGAGHLGHALATYVNYEKRGFVFKALFDVNPELIGKDIRGAKVYPMDELEKYLKENDIQIVALCVPKDNANDVAEKLIQYGVKAIWNFAHIDIDAPEDVIVENVHLSESLMRLSYKINSRNR